jgi:hypothetical protein
VWQIDMANDAGELTCVSRITMAVLAPRSKSSEAVADPAHHHS